MTLDPRNAIVALFTDGLISASTEDGTKYVGIMLYEDNPTRMSKRDWAGVIILEQVPNATIVTISIGGKVINEMVTILANMWVDKKPGMLNPDVFVKAVLDAFQNAIIDHHTDIDTDTKFIQVTSIQTLPSDSPEVMRRAITLSAQGYRIRP